ncbi:MAG: prepilin-type N-terminal cleavage/methylation domain-containing protein [Chloroflexi bacterium]|nr:prepilin-type N-terminal cleavage/methylation domain-containing protein [Chloroflexota bacterium]
MMPRRRQRGLSLIEVAVALAVTAILVPAISALLVQLVRLPPRSQASVGAQNEAREAMRWLNADGARAQHFVLGASPDYGTFLWRDYTLASQPLVAARYYYEDGRLRREQTVNGTTTIDTTVARNVAAYADFSMTSCPGQVTGDLLTTANGDGSTVTYSAPFSLRLRPEPWGDIPANPMGYAVFASGGSGAAVKDINVTGSGALIAGNAHANGSITIAGTGHSVSDVLSAVGTVTTPPGMPVGAIAEGASTQAGPYNCQAGETPSATYSWLTDVDLSTVQEVWQDWPARTALRPGVYYSAASITLGLNSVTGTVTFIGDQVSVTGTGVRLWPYAGGTTIFATGSAADSIRVEVSGARWRGALYAPNGGVLISPPIGDFTLYGSIVAQGVTLSGADLRVVHSAY